VDRHLQSVIDKAGRVDISFNALGIPDSGILGVPLVELGVEQFSLPIASYGPAQAAKEALTRDLSAELAPHGIRVVGLRPQAILETRTIKNAYQPRAKATGMTWEQWQEMLASGTHWKRLMRLAEMANLAVFVGPTRRAG